jgi:hypothetical protein
MKPANIQVLVTLARANARPVRKTDTARLDEALMNDSAELVHGCGYCLNSTSWEKPIISGEFLEVAFFIEVEAYDDQPMTEAELAAEVENDIGFFPPLGFEVESITTRLL